MMRPFPCAIFRAYNNWAGLTGLSLRFPAVFTVGFLGRVFVEEFAADRDRGLVAGRRLDALLADEAVGKPLHGRRWRIRCRAVTGRSTKQGRPSGGGAVLQPADDAL